MALLSRPDVPGQRVKITAWVRKKSFQMGRQPKTRFMQQQGSVRAQSANSVWSLGIGCLTLLLSVFAFFLPEFETLPKSGLVGWLLVFAGIPELFFGWQRQPDLISRAAVGSG